MPVYNEERTIFEIIKRVLAQKIVDKLIIINDSSTDGSDQIIRQAVKGSNKIKYLVNSRNFGKGYCVRKGLSSIDKGIVIIQDADLEYSPEDYPKLINALDDNTVVYGTRMQQKNQEHPYALAKIANTTITFLFNLLYSSRLTDLNTCYKIFRKDTLNGIKLKEDRFLIEPELSITFAKKRYRIREVRIRYRGRTYEEGKKIRAKDAIAQIIYIIKNRLFD